MPSSYPGSLDNLPTTYTDSTISAGTHAAAHNNANDAINKLEAEVGTNAKGSFASVAARLAKPDVATFARAGTLLVVAGQGRFVFPFAATLVGVQAACGTAPVGAAIIVDVNKNGTTVFTTQANRPQIPAGANVSTVATPDVTAVAAGDYLSVDIDQVGSTSPGSDLSVMVTYTR